MIARLRTLMLFSAVVMLLGCASDSSRQAGKASPEQDGWTRLGQVAVPQDRDQDVVAANQLPGSYRSIRFDADGPAQIHRIAVVYDDGSTFLPEQGLTFDNAGSRTLMLPGDPHKIERVALSYSGARMLRKTTVTLWVK